MSFIKRITYLLTWLPVLCSGNTLDSINNLLLYVILYAYSMLLISRMSWNTILGVRIQPRVEPGQCLGEWPSVGGKPPRRRTRHPGLLSLSLSERLPYVKDQSIMCTVTILWKTIRTCHWIPHRVQAYIIGSSASEATALWRYRSFIIIIIIIITWK